MEGLPMYQSFLSSNCRSFDSRAATFTYWSSSKWQNQLLSDCRKSSSSACILQHKACRLWSLAHLVSTRWPPANAFVSKSTSSVKKNVLEEAWVNQVASTTPSRDLWNFLLVFTEMKMSLRLVSGGSSTALLLPLASLVNRIDCVSCGSVWWALRRPRPVSFLWCCPTRVSTQMVRMNTTMEAPITIETNGTFGILPPFSLIVSFSLSISVLASNFSIFTSLLLLLPHHIWRRY